MDPFTDQPLHELQDISSSAQESSAISSVPSTEPTSSNSVAPEPSSDDNPVNTVSHPPIQTEASQPTDDAHDAQHLRFGPYSHRYYPQHPSYRLSRDELREIAAATLDALESGCYYPPDLVESGQQDEKVEEIELPENNEEQPLDSETQQQDSDTVDQSEEQQQQDTSQSDDKEEDKPEIQDGTDEVLYSEVDGKEENSRIGRNAGKEPFDLKTMTRYTNEHTLYAAPDDEALGLWFQADLPVLNREQGNHTKIIIAEYSTLFGSKRLHELAQNQTEPKGRIGVLNFASPKKPGGGFLNGSQAQEESLARSSTLFPSLLTPAAKQFYKLYSSDPDNAFYTHAMVYSPSVILFRDDKGDWTAPLEIDILTSAAVNAGDVRKQVRWEEEMRALRERVRVAELARRRELSLPSFLPTYVRIYESEPQKDEVTESGQQSLARSEQPFAGSAQVSPIIFASDPPSPPLEPLSLPPSDLVSPFSPTHTPSSVYPHPPNVDPLTHAENLIAAAMQERIARILYLFHLRGARHIVLGSFGTGVFQNSVQLIAKIFKDLLCDSDPEEKEQNKEEERSGDQNSRDEKSGVEDKKSPDIRLQCRGKFKDAFDTVMFAILGGSTVRTFREVFDGVEGLDYDDEVGGSDVEGMKDVADEVHPPPPQSLEECNPPA